MSSFCLEVHGDFACFTRPEMKVERVSYELITPSSVRSIFESILWKPAMCWVPERVDLLAPVRWVSIRRNEIGGKISTANVKTVMKDGYGDIGLFIEEDRQQRAGLILRDVRYRLHASIKLTPKAQADDTLIKFERMFTRRAEKGQCINQPYLGCREFACDFFLCNCSTTRGYLDPIPENRDLGWMLYDMDYSNPVDPKPRFFKAALKSGIVWIPDRNSYGVRG